MSSPSDKIIAAIPAQPGLGVGVRGRGLDEVSLAKVLLFPHKWSALLELGCVADGFDTTYPVSVELSLTNRCNQNCIWCSDRQLRERCPDRLTPELLESLFADLARGGTKGVTIEGGGEPTLSPYLTEAVSSARKYGLAVGLITNGLELFEPDPNLYVLYEKLEWIRVSLDAANEGQYLAAKGVNGFERVLRNLARLKEVAGGATLGVGYVLTRANDDPDLLQGLTIRLRDIGLDYLQIRPVVDHPELESERLPYFLKKYETSEFTVNLEGLTENQPFGNLGLPCRAHSLSSVIGADGAVWLCGRLNIDTETSATGSLLDNDFKGIWLGTERARQSGLVAEGEFCRKHCPRCRMTKYNQLLDDLGRLKTRNFI